MNRIFFAFLAALVLVSCNSTSPEQYFSQATLNSNLLYGFAGEGMQREFASPSVKLTDANTGAIAAMKREEVLKAKLDAVEEAYKKIRDLKPAEESKEMINASKVLFEFVIPVYKNEYKELAALYDTGAGAEKIAALETSISDKYYNRFTELCNALHAAGKAYAAKHGIKVMDVDPSPPKAGQ